MPKGDKHCLNKELLFLVTIIYTTNEEQRLLFQINNREKISMHVFRKIVRVAKMLLRLREQNNSCHHLSSPVMNQRDEEEHPGDGGVFLSGPLFTVR